MFKMNNTDFIKGLTTNPSLMKKAGILDYQKFALEILSEIKEKPISFEVFSDEFDEMENQARIINSWAKNVYVKIPITNTKQISSFSLINKLSNDNIKLNITAITTAAPGKKILPSLNKNTPSIISVFAGRIADTGNDPLPVMKECLEILKDYPKAELLWASPRELLNIFQAEDIGCNIITVTKNIIDKFKFINYDLDQYSLDTVKDFYNDSLMAKYKI